MKRFVKIGVMLGIGIGFIAARAASLDCEQFKTYQNSIAELIRQYEVELGFLSDPFLTAFTKDEANDAYQSLLHRSDGLFCVNSPLYKIQHELMRPALPEFNHELVSEIIHDASEQLGASTETRDMQSNLLALKSTRDYVNRFPVCPIEQSKETDKKDGRAKKKSEQQEKKQKRQQSQKRQNQQQNQQKQQQQQSQSPQNQQQSQQQEPEQDPEYPEFGDDYEPHTKDTGRDGNNNDGKTQSKTVIAEVDFKTRYFGTNVFTQIVRHNPRPFQKSDRLDRYYASLAGSVKQTTSQKTMIVRPLGKQNIPLFMPPGWQPATMMLNNAEITQEKGTYRLSMIAPLDHVTIPLMRTPRHSLSQYYEDILTERVGFADNEWPETIQTAILHKYKKGDDRAVIAKAIEKHLADDYLYSRDARPETDPIDALNAGAFQCDMASFIMAGILRDVYKIPCRVIAGLPAKMRKNGSREKSYLVASHEGHAWVEVFHDNTWNTYDPTPQKKDKKDEGQGEKSDFTDVPPDEQRQNADGQEGRQESQKESKQASQTDGRQQQEVKREGQEAKGGSSIDDFIKKTQDLIDKKDDKNQGGEKESTDNQVAGSGDTGSGNDPAENKEAEEKKHEEEQQKKLDELPELKDSLARVLQEEFPDTNLLRKECLKLVLIEALNPLKSGNDAASRLDMIKNLFAQFDKQKLALINEALEQHKDMHDVMIEWVKDLRYGIFDQDINLSYKDLFRMLKILRFYKEIIDDDEIRFLTGQIIDEILKTVALLRPLKDQAAADMALLDDVKKHSPVLLWEALKSIYDLHTIGPDMPTRNLAQALRAGKHNDHLLLSALYAHTNFILNASLKAGSMLVKTWLRDGQKRGSDFLLTDRMQDWRSAIATDHRYDLLENIRRGMAFAMTKRKKVAVPQPNDNKEAKRISIVGFDVSGSMAGRNAEFQAALIAAFVCRALEDVSPTGIHRHTVLLVPFDHDVHSPQRIEDTQEALDLIKNHQSILANRGGGTDIQKFLLQAMKLISEAQDIKNPFEIANIILMSDGGSSVNYDELVKARRQIHRDTPLQMMFAAIGSTNEDLKRFALDSQKMGAQEGFYKEFLSEDINKIIDEAHSIDMKKYDSYFFTSQTPDKVPHQAADYLLSAYKKLESLAIRIQNRMSGQGLNYRQNVALFANNRPREKYNARPLESWILQVRQMTANPTYSAAFHDDKILNFILNNIVNNFQKITGVALSEVTQYENEEMVHWLSDPQVATNARSKP